VGAIDDLIYFGPRLGPLRAARLFAAKTAKRRRLARVDAALVASESAETRARRLGLPEAAPDRLALLRERLAGAATVLPLTPGPADAARGRAVTRGRQLLFGAEQEVGWPPNWDWRWDGDPRAETFAADVRSTWEIQRLQGILPLARVAAAAQSSVDRDQAAGNYLDAVRSFHRRHPGPAGTAWESALELGLRLIALAQGSAAVAPTEAFKLHADLVLEILDRHARRLRADLSLDKVVRGNHLLGELAGLVVVGHLIPEARAAWGDGLDVQALLEREILAQFHPDGVNVEQSLTYEKFILEFLVVVAVMARLRDRPLADEVLERMDAAADHLRACAGTAGKLPHVGDCDSGRGADLGDTDPDDPGRVLLAMSGLSIPASSSASTQDLLEVEGTGPRVREFPHGGHVVAGGKGMFLFLRGGRFGHGIPGPCSHSHADLLAPVIHVRGEAVLVDPGVYGYAIGPDRDAERRRAAHNAIDLDPPAPPEPAGLFRWRRIPRAATLRVTPEDEGFRLDGASALGPGPRPLLWHRVLRYNQLAESWSIVDSIRGSYRGPVIWAFHFAPGASLEPIEGAVRVRLGSGTRVLLRLWPAGEVRLETGWVAPAYGRRVEAPVAVRRLEAPFDRAEAELAPDPA